MKFWEEVAEAGGILEDFKRFIDVKNSITAPVCSTCTNTCCNGDQVRGVCQWVSASPITIEITKISLELQRLNPDPDRNRKCTYLVGNKCLIEDIKPPVCIKFFCDKLRRKIGIYNRRKDNKIKLDFLLDKLEDGLYRRAREHGKRRDEYYVDNLHEFLRESSGIRKLLEEWKYITDRYPPSVWYFHGQQMSEYYRNIARQWENARCL